VNKQSFLDSLLLRRQSQYFSTMMPACQNSETHETKTAMRKMSDDPKQEEP
jgi:hypothetical protein